MLLQENAGPLQRGLTRGKPFGGGSEIESWLIRSVPMASEVFLRDGEDTFSSPGGGYGEEYILMIGTGERVETPSRRAAEHDDAAVNPRTPVSLD